MKFTNEEIEQAKQQYINRYRKLYWYYLYIGNEPDILHQHIDCIFIAAEFLAAQKQTKHPRYHRVPLKHIIERWAGRYVSEDDVSVAAILLGLKGDYPDFNFSTRLVFPNQERLSNIDEAFQHQYKSVSSGDYFSFTYWENKAGSLTPIKRNGRYKKYFDSYQSNYISKEHTRFKAVS